MPSCTSEPISPPGGMVMMTSWVCRDVASTRRKSSLFLASVKTSPWKACVSVMGVTLPSRFRH
jgi:hypothetical protein